MKKQSCTWALARAAWGDIEERQKAIAIFATVRDLRDN